MARFLKFFSLFASSSPCSRGKHRTVVSSSLNRRNSSLFIVSLAILLFWFAKPSPAFAHYFSLGLAAVESGNDRFRPAASASVGVGSIAFADVSLWGRSMGPIEEESMLVTLGGKWPLGVSRLYVSVGISAVREETNINFASEYGGPEKEVSLSHGISLGTGFTLFRIKNFRSDVTWVSNIYPAGSIAILLAHGRKQLITLSSGIDL